MIERHHRLEHSSEQRLLVYKSLGNNLRSGLLLCLHNMSDSVVPRLSDGQLLEIRGLSLSKGKRGGMGLTQEPYRLI